MQVGMMWYALTIMLQVQPRQQVERQGLLPTPPIFMMQQVMMYRDQTPRHLILLSRRLRLPATTRI